MCVCVRARVCVAQAREVFQRYDQDKSGTIDAAELRAVCYELGVVLFHAGNTNSG